MAATLMIGFVIEAIGKYYLFIGIFAAKPNNALYKLFSIANDSGSANPIDLLYPLINVCIDLF
jgi:hypothetical protein